VSLTEKNYPEPLVCIPSLARGGLYGSTVTDVVPARHANFGYQRPRSSLETSSHLSRSNCCRNVCYAAPGNRQNIIRRGWMTGDDSSDLRSLCLASELGERSQGRATS
jgi:hypothetical protein